MKVSKRLIIVIDKYALRLNRPYSTGWLRKIDRFIFKYSSDKYGLPCFLPLPLLKYQLIVDGKPIYSGGGVNCFNEPIKVYPVIVDKETESKCKEAVELGYFKIRNFTYNGFGGSLKKGYTNLKPKLNELILTNDPGIYRYNDILIPSFAIEGVSILCKVKEDNKIPDLFGIPSTTN